MAFYQAMSWHEGEERIHKLTRVPPSDNPTQPMLAQSSARRVTASPLIALGTLDDQDRVWCTVWGGDVPIAQLVARGGVIGVRTQVDTSFDPVVEALYGGKDNGEVVRHDPKDGKMVSGLSIHLEERDRVKLFGRMLAGSLTAGEAKPATAEPESTSDAGGKPGKTGDAQLVLHITQSLGNCPKYLNKKVIKSYPNAKPRLISDSPHLSAEAVSHIHTADLFFIASRGPEDMDCNHRGGPPGFVRVQQPSNDSSSSALIWPEYSGNNLYQTLGNIAYTPTSGIVVPNFTNGNVLYLTGTSEVLAGQDAMSVISKTKLAVRFTITAARFVHNGLSFRSTLSADNKDVSSSHPTISRPITDGQSPYNPRIRYLTTENSNSTNPTTLPTLPPDEFQDQHRSRTTPDLSATLIKKTPLSPTITKYRFALSAPDSTSFDPAMSPLWQPGQYIALDFSDELYMGYSHMRDDNPGALNDDFIRTFTVASIYVPPEKGRGQVEFEIIVRGVGSVTRWLKAQNDRTGLTKIGVRGFGGNFRFAVPVSVPVMVEQSGNEDHQERKKKSVFLAAGVGITPLLGQVDANISSKDQNSQISDGLIVLWTVNVKDIGLVVDVVRNAPACLKKGMIVFVTGTAGRGADDEYVGMLGGLEKDADVRDHGVRIERRRMIKSDLVGLQEDGGVEIENWYLCTAPAMRKEIQEWLDGRTLVFENFDY